jgi:phosphohistidine phosphatase
MRLYIVRHGKAQELDSDTCRACVLPTANIIDDGEVPELSNFGRPLTARGRAQAEYLATALRGRERRLHTILSSPYLRAVDTAKILLAALPGADLRTEPALVPERGVQAALSVIRRNDHDRALMLVGHNPQLGELLALLIAGLPASDLILKTGELVALEITPANLVGTGRLLGRLRLGDAKLDAANPSEESIAGLCVAPPPVPTPQVAPTGGRG